MQPLKLKGFAASEKKVLLSEGSGSEKYQEEGDLQCLERVEDGKKGAELEEEKKMQRKESNQERMKRQGMEALRNIEEAKGQ